MMEFFIGNPFSTPVGQLIESATSSSLPSEDWGLNMDICDIINETDDGAKDAVRAIKKRILGNRNFKEVMLALSVLEACVKNCGHKFHSYVSTRDFVENVLVQAIMPKNNPPLILQDRVLTMIQAWSDAFRSSPDLTGVVTVYEDLRRKGVQFPMTALKSPIHTPDRTVGFVSPVSAPVTDSKPHSTETQLTMSPQQMKKLTTDLDMVRNNLSMMSDMMSRMEPDGVQQSDTALLQQLYATCKDMQGRMVSLIPALTDEKLTQQLLTVNDNMNTTFAQYHRFERHFKQQSNTQSTANRSAIGQSAVNMLSNQMAGLTEFKSSAESISAPHVIHLDWWFSNCPENTVAIDGLAAIPRKQQDTMQIPVDQSDMMDDIEQWLDVDIQEDDSEGVTSEEFNKFLAARAKAAERLPSVNETLRDPDTSRP